MGVANHIPTEFSVKYRTLLWIRIRVSGSGPESAKKGSKVVPIEGLQAYPGEIL
jgi:hypothetical protein